jgi:hypothetical protein
LQQYPRMARRYSRARSSLRLRERPEITRAYLANTRPDGCGVITLVVRNIGTCELVIPSERYDALAVMQFLRGVLSS